MLFARGSHQLLPLTCARGPFLSPRRLRYKRNRMHVLSSDWKMGPQYSCYADARGRLQMHAAALSNYQPGRPPNCWVHVTQQAAKCRTAAYRYLTSSFSPHSISFSLYCVFFLLRFPGLSSAFSSSPAQRCLHFFPLSTCLARRPKPLQLSDTDQS